MNSVQARIPRWIGGYQPQPATRWPAAPAARQAPESAEKSFALTGDESARFFRVVAECGRVRRHYDIYRWLGGEVQHFLPHEILLSAWGDFDSFDVKLDLTSALPGVRTGQLAHCRVDSLVRQAYARWIDARREPVTLKCADTEASQPGCHCPIHSAFRSMRSVLVHGVHDKRSGEDSLFIAFTCGSFTKGKSLSRFVSLLEPLVAQIDSAFRKVQAFPLAESRYALRGGANVLDLSSREMEVLDALCRGRTNLQIAATLDISPFTVKNHVQRIFRKIGVTNRTQAAARYTEAVRQAALGLAAQKPAEAPAHEAAQPSSFAA
jgi:transcriptional regulator EpsA